MTLSLDGVCARAPTITTLPTLYSKTQRKPRRGGMQERTGTTERSGVAGWHLEALGRLMFLVDAAEFSLMDNYLSGNDLLYHIQLNFVLLDYINILHCNTMRLSSLSSRDCTAGRLRTCDSDYAAICACYWVVPASHYRYLHCHANPSPTIIDSHT
jgi:hypothetical protein